MAKNTGRQQNEVVEEIVPSHAWTEDLDGHYLLVDLPDFKKEQVKIEVIDSGVIKVSGERPINKKKRVRFDQTFKVPENTVINAISAKFKGELQILYMTFPKQKPEQKKEPEHGPEPEPPGLINGQKNANNAHKENDNGDESKNKDNDSRDGDQECEAKEKEPSKENDQRSRDREPSSNYYLRNAVEILAKNKRIVVAAMLAFSLGMLISRKLELNED